MKIAYVAAGAAGMYCGSCLHDNTLAAALLAQGEDVVLIPTYTPLRTDETDVSQRRVFFGGINVYLQQKSALFRHTPWWLDRLLDHPAILERLSRRAASVDPAQLGDLTVSMLRGEVGHQRKELQKLAHWLHHEFQPDVIHLSNTMLLGMVRTLRRECGPPLVCSLSGEDIFLERLTQPFYDQARALLRERAADVHAFVALNNYYADFMAEYLDVARDRISVIPHGLRLEGHGPRPARPEPATRRVGYLARICPEKGLHLLVEACAQLAQRSDLPPLELHVAGHLSAGDNAYWQDVQSAINSGPLVDRFRYWGEVDRPGKIEFLQSLDVFSVPTVYRESKGLPALEALANAVPVVLPDHGSFPELVADTQAGLLCQPLDAGDLADKLAQLLSNPQQAESLGRAGHDAVHARYHDQAMADQTMQLYRRLIDGC